MARRHPGKYKGNTGPAPAPLALDLREPEPVAPEGYAFDTSVDGLVYDIPPMFKPKDGGWYCRPCKNLWLDPQATTCPTNPNHTPERVAVVDDPCGYFAEEEIAIHVRTRRHVENVTGTFEKDWTIDDYYRRNKLDPNEVIDDGQDPEEPAEADDN